MHALRRANPRAQVEFTEAVDAAAGAVRARIERERPGRAPRRRDVRLPVVGLAALSAAAALAVLGALGLRDGPAALEDATAAVRAAAAASAPPAERSGTAVVRITHDGALWAGSTLRWNGDDLSVSRTSPARSRRPGSEWLVVGGMMYGLDERDGAWVELGSPDSIDPGSGTTPAEYLAALRRDAGGETLRRIADGMTGPTARQLADGSTVYAGRLPAGLLASEAGVKDGEAIRVLPFGFVAHDEAAEASSLLDVAVTAGPDGRVRAIAASWGTWTYHVRYRGLGTTAEIRAPADARPLRRARG
jgi:hypothetical protein